MRRALLRILLALPAAAVALGGASAWGAKADQAYQQARADYLKLRSDEKARRFRHNWQNAAKKLTRAAQALGSAELGAEAWYTLGELQLELNRFSGQREDLDAGLAAFEKVSAKWPRHRLADDAALMLAKALAQAGDDAGARRALEAAPEGDRRKDVAALLAKLTAAAPKKGAPAKADADEGAAAAKGARSAGKRGGPARADAEEDDAAAAKGAKSAGKKSGPARADAEEDDAAAAKGAKSAGKKSGPARADAEEDDAVAAKGARSAAKKGARALADADRTPAAPEKKSAAQKPTPDTRSEPGARSSVAAGEAAAGSEADSEGLGADDRSAMGEAIRRAILSRDGRRMVTDEARPSPLPPRREPGRLGDEDEDAPAPSGLHLPRLADLQEKLRDVRVGPPVKEAKLDDAKARLRLKQLAHDEAGSELTLAEQLGLKMRRVVIDAGHGGHDTGAIGPTGVQEKDVSLAIALKLAKKLSDYGLEVVLTRDDDTFVRLEDRTHIANQQKGDLFVSIHCNAAPSRGLRGIETYTLNTTADRYTVRLAARENATAERGVSDLQLILADLATKANTGESQRLAGRVQRSMVGGLAAKHKGLRDLGTKEALFYVLLGAKMPAILVETSFLSNPEEEKLLGSDAYQGDVAQAIAEAVEGYISERDDKLAKID